MTDAEGADPLAVLLVDLEFTARVWNLIERRGLVTLRDLVMLDPWSLPAEPNLGRKSIADLRTFIEARLGTTWEQAAADPSPCVATEPLLVRNPRSWRELSRAVPDGLRAVSLALLPDLPTRILGLAMRSGVTTLGALVDIPEPVIRAEPNVGRKSLADTLEVISGFVEASLRGESSASSIEATPNLLALWCALAAKLDLADRLVLQHRAGIGSEPLTLAEVGELFSFSRERVRQLEVRALDLMTRDRRWVDEVEARLMRLLADGARPVDDVVSDDPWFVSLRDERPFGKFFFDRVLSGRVAYVTLDETDLIATFTQDAVNGAWAGLDRGLRDAVWPATFAAVDDETTRAAAPYGSTVVEVFRRRVTSKLIFHGDATRVMGYGYSRASAVTAFLRGASGPVAGSEIVRRFGRGGLPDDVVYMERGLVTVVDRLEGFEACARRLLPICESWMRAQGSGRQWSCDELAEVVSSVPDLPAWFGPWPLAAMCARSDLVRYLGRLAVVLPEVEGERIYVRDVLAGVLEEAGGPLPGSVLRERTLQRRHFGMLTFDMMLTRHPFVEVERDVWGLRSRDLPEGETAAERALEWIIESLEARGRGITYSDGLARLRARSGVFERWTESMLVSVVRDDVRVLTSMQRVFGLAEWGDVRLPSRREIVSQCLEEGGGRASIKVVQARLAALYDETPTRNAVTWTAWTLGARVSDGVLVLRNATQEASLQTSIEGIPPIAVALFESLRKLPLGDVEELRQAVDADVRRFFHEAVTSASIDLTVVLAAQRKAYALLAIAPGLDAEAQGVLGGAVRYFLHDDDGAWDFTVDGLVDDIAVLDAAIAALGVDEIA